MLPLQGTSYQKAYSLDRDTQLRTVLEAAFEGAIGSGIMAGGVVTPTAGFGAEVAAGTTFFTKGVAYTISVARALTAPTPSATNYAWWKLTRTAASQAAVTNLDTWALSVDYTTINTPPSADHHPLTNLVCDGSGVTSVVDPAGKYVGVLRVDEAILRDGSRDFTGPQSMAGFALTDLPDPVDDGDAAPAGWVTDSITAAIAALSIPSLTGVIRSNGSIDFAADQSMGGFHLTDVPDPTADDHAVNKQWVVALVGGGGTLSFLKIDGTSVMGGNLDAGGHQVVNAADPTTDQALVTRSYLLTALGSYVVTGFLPLSGSEAMTGPLDAGTHQIIHVSDPSADHHAANQGWTNTRVGTRLPLSGGTMTGDIDLDGNTLTGLPDPVADTDGVPLAWFTDRIAAGTGQPIFFGIDGRPADVAFTSGELLGCLSMPQDVVWGGSMTSAKSSARSKTQATATAVCKIYKNILGTGRTEIGTITFSSGSYAGVINFPDPVTLTQHQLIEVDAPATPDDTLAFLAITLAGELA